MRTGFGSQATALWILGAIGIASACTRTADPVEHFRARTAQAGTAAAVGGTMSEGGTGPGATAGTSPSGTSGSVTTGGEDPGPVGGQGGEGNVAPEPPTDFGCGDPPVSSEAFSRRALRAAAAECAQWHYCRFEASARQLSDELNEHLAAPTPDSLERARSAFTTAFSLSSVNELFQFGPLASQAESAGKDGYQGKGLRELIYSWPNSARCRVEEQLVTRAYAQSFNNLLVSARGLFALDYLLYYPASDTACAASSATGKAWASMSEADIAVEKAEYAAAIGEDVLLHAEALRQAWSPDAGNFAPVFVETTGYPTEQEAMKVMAWSLLYIEREVKDYKLGVPAMHTVGAPVSVAEAAYSGLKIDAIRQNLVGFRGLFQGCGADGAGLGFDDWLTEAGHGELADEVLRAYDAAQAAADAAAPLDEMTPAQLEALYQAIKRLTDFLKNDLFGAGSPLGLTLPKGLEGDTD